MGHSTSEKILRITALCKLQEFQPEEQKNDFDLSPLALALAIQEHYLRDLWFSGTMMNVHSTWQHEVANGDGTVIRCFDSRQ